MAINHSNVAAISQKLYNAVLQAGDEYSANEAAKAAKSKANGDLMSAREKVLSMVAGLSAAEQWSNQEILLAAKAAGEMYQGNDKAEKSHIQTLVNHCKAAAHPLVRDRFADLHAIVLEAIELESIPEADRPVLKLFKRRYHAIVGVMRVVADNVNPIADVDDLIQYAKDNDPDFDAAKMFKKLQSLVGDLSEMNRIFPINAIADAVSKLAQLDERDLKNARASKTIARTAAPATVAAKPTPAKPNEPAAAHPFTKAQAKPTATTATDIATTLNDHIDDLTADVELAEAA